MQDILFKDVISEIDEYAIFSLDTDGNIQNWNPGARKIKGYTEKEIIGKHFSVFYTIEDRVDKVPLKLLEISKKDGRAVCEGWRVRKNGDRFWASVVITAIHKDEEIIGFTKITHDLTERKLLMDRIVESKVKAEEANRLKSAFLATINHELRTPLNHIIEFSRFVKETTAESDVIEYAKIINESGHNLLTIIEDILNIALMKTHKIKPCCQSINTGDLYDEIVNMACEILFNSGKNGRIRLKTEMEYHKIAREIITDKYKLKQILKNLLSNAIKFTDEGTVTICISQRNENQLAIAIKDTGIGIPEEKKRIVFELFTQVDSSLSRDYEGTGIGLAIANQIAKILGGNITLVSQLGYGSTFTLFIPIDLSEKCNSEGK